METMQLETIGVRIYTTLLRDHMLSMWLRGKITSGVGARGI